MALHLPRIPFFRIFYSGTFTLFTLLLIALLLISPGDHIYQSFQSGQLYHIIIVGAVYVLTFILAVFIYAGRLFSTRSALAGIPREWNLAGTEKNWGVGLGMGRRMGRVVREGLQRSAIIAYEARPRDMRGEKTVRHVDGRKGKRRKGGREDRQGSAQSSAEPVWGRVNHAGWASPESPDLPNLHFEPVVAELGHLIEAKAVSLAPVDPLWKGDRANEEEIEEESTMPDPFAVELLQRPIATSLREYVAYLMDLGMLSQMDLLSDFLTLYDRARFGDSPLKEEEFRTLMGIFAETLRTMTPLDIQVVDDFREAATEELMHEHLATGSDDDQSFSSNGTTRHIPLPYVYSPVSSFASHSNNRAILHTAPSRPGNSRTASNFSQRSNSSSASVLYSRRKSSPSSLMSAASRGSLSNHSGTTSTAGSVIRLAEARTPLDLPYTIVNSSQQDF